MPTISIAETIFYILLLPILPMTSKHYHHCFHHSTVSGSFFHNSPKKLGYFDEIHSILDDPVLQLVRAGDTRWTSNYRQSGPFESAFGRSFMRYKKFMQHRVTCHLKQADYCWCIKTNSHCC